MHVQDDNNSIRNNVTAQNNTQKQGKMSVLCLSLARFPSVVSLFVWSVCLPACAFLPASVSPSLTDGDVDRTTDDNDDEPRL